MPTLFEYNTELLTISERKSFFLSFLESEHSEENLLFYLDALNYKEIKEEKERIEKAFTIYHQYIKFYVINISSSCFAFINQNYELGKPDLFVNAAEEVLLNMKDPFVRFKKSKEFKVMLRVNFNKYQQNLIQTLESYY